MSIVKSFLKKPYKIAYNVLYHEFLDYVFNKLLIFLKVSKYILKCCLNFFLPKIIKDVSNIFIYS